MVGHVEFDESKFKDLLLYVAKRLANDPTFGETKLNKVMFFSDFEGYRLLGAPITGAEYQKNKYGPTARLYTVMRDELIRWGQIEVERRMVVDHPQDVVRLKNIEPNMSRFKPEEIELIDRIIEKMRRYNNKEVSDLSHERAAGWNVAEHFGDEIPYETAFISTDLIPEEDLVRAQEFVREQGWVRA